MYALVTGATGFFGSALVLRLVKDGWGVDAITRKKQKPGKAYRKVRFIQADISDLDSLKKVVKKADVVFNLAAALPHHRLPEREYWKTNVEGVRNLLEVSGRKRIDCFVHVSTVGVYGPSPKVNTDEKSPFVLQDVYSITKAKGEEIVWDYIKSKGINASIIRPTIGYGPGDTRPVFRSLFSLIKKRLFIPIGKGDNFFHTIYVDNLIDSLMLAATKRKAIGQDFIIGDDPCPTMQQIGDTAADFFGHKPVPVSIPKQLAFSLAIVSDLLKGVGFPALLTTQRLRFITEDKKFKIDKAKRLLGYRPKVSLIEGVKRTIKWYKMHGYI